MPTTDQGWGHTVLGDDDDFPAARVVRAHGVPNGPPPAPPGVLGRYARAGLVYAIGLWPLTGVVLLSIGLAVAATR
jgi:hypothetical protein